MSLRNVNRHLQMKRKTKDEINESEYPRTVRELEKSITFIVLVLATESIRRREKTTE